MCDAFCRNAMLSRPEHDLWRANKSKKTSTTRKRLAAARVLSAEDAVMLRVREEARCKNKKTTKKTYQEDV